MTVGPGLCDNGAMMVSGNVKAIQVQYYALLREERGMSTEAVLTDAATPRTLYEELRSRHRFSLSADQMQVAVNEAFADWDQPLSSQDTVVFIPPVAGG